MLTGPVPVGTARAGSPASIGAPARSPRRAGRSKAHALGCELSHVELADVTGDAGIVAVKDASARLTDVTCARCTTATLGWECGAHVTASQIGAGPGTPAAEHKPDCE